jgi:hypothetical protein
VTLLADRGRFTDLAPGWTPSSSLREAQIERLQSYLDAARHELAGRHQAQLGLFRRPRLDATSRRAQEQLDAILMPDEPKGLWYLVSVLSAGSYDGPTRGIWRGFGPGFLGRSLRIEDPETCACSTNIHPANLVSVEVLEVVWESDDDWCDG